MATSQLSNEPENSFNTFTCFPRLPPEIRVMIWHLALPKNKTYTLGHAGLNQEFTVYDSVEDDGTPCGDLVSLNDPFNTLIHPVPIQPSKLKFAIARLAKQTAKIRSLLSTNQEARVETLKLLPQKMVFPRPRQGLEQNPPVVIYCDPAVDLFEIIPNLTDTTIGSDWVPIGGGRWIDEFSKIENLAINNRRAFKEYDQMDQESAKYITWIKCMFDDNEMFCRFYEGMSIYAQRMFARRALFPGLKQVWIGAIVRWGGGDGTPEWYDDPEDGCSYRTASSPEEAARNVTLWPRYTQFSLLTPDPNLPEWDLDVAVYDDQRLPCLYHDVSN